MTTKDMAMRRPPPPNTNIGAIGGSTIGGAPKSSLFRTPAGGAAASGSRTEMQEHREQSMVEENDAMLAALSADVSALKRASQGLRDEVKEHLSLMDRLTNAFDSSRGALAGTMGRLEKVMKNGNSRHMWLLAVFVLSVFIFLYYILRSKSSK